MLRNQDFFIHEGHEGHQTETVNSCFFASFVDNQEIPDNVMQIKSGSRYENRFHFLRCARITGL